MPNMSLEISQKYYCTLGGVSIPMDRKKGDTVRWFPGGFFFLCLGTIEGNHFLEFQHLVDASFWSDSLNSLCFFFGGGWEAVALRPRQLTRPANKIWSLLVVVP